MMDWNSIAPPISYQFTKYANYKGRLLPRYLSRIVTTETPPTGSSLTAWLRAHNVDYAVVPWVPSTTGSSAPSAPTSASSPAPTALGQSELSLGVSAGIGLGAGIGVLLLALSGTYIFQLLRRRRATSAKRQRVQPALRIFGPAELG
jgi:hypothetical protein